MLLSGELNRQIRILKRLPGEDDAGVPNGAYALHRLARARYSAPAGMGLISAERVQADAEVSAQQCVWRIRWCNDVTAAMKVEETIGGFSTTWDIKQVIPDRRKGGWVDLVCEAVT